MVSEFETILSILPGQSDDVRTVVAMRHGDDGATIELRQESFSQAVGWFMQSRIELTGDQVGGLRQTLGLVPSRSARPSAVAASENSLPATLAFPGMQRAATA
ncbi:hypothetical protein [Roseimaritima sediminicola]|uniref:hypothetical protein n=1 Tax=Roseimaritima sediminicola TaxID=2662066 RepID=UPI0013867778|nr:hypothetical protein [Roseimaritima sediminicola]